MRRRAPALGAVSRVKFAVGARCYGRSHVVATRLFDPHRCASPPPVAGGADVRVGTPRHLRRACRRSLRAFAIPRSLSRLRGPSRFRPTSPPRAVGTFVDARLLRLIPLGRKPVPAAGGGPRPAFFISALPRPVFPPAYPHPRAGSAGPGAFRRASAPDAPCRRDGGRPSRARYANCDRNRTPPMPKRRILHRRAAIAAKLRFRYRRKRQGLLVCAQRHTPLGAAKGRSVHGGPSPAAPVPAVPADAGRA